MTYKLYQAPSVSPTATAFRPRRRGASIHINPGGYYYRVSGCGKPLCRPTVPPPPRSNHTECLDKPPPSERIDRRFICLPYEAQQCILYSHNTFVHLPNRHILTNVLFLVRYYIMYLRRYN